MKDWCVAILAAATLAATASPVAAQSREDETLEERLADAQKRLEEAAREVAELSGEAAGQDGFRRFEYLLPGRRRAMLGVNLGGAEPDGGGVRVESVSPGGPAADAGVKAGDVIVTIESKAVTTGRELVRIMETVEPGEKVRLGLRREGKPLQLSVEARPIDHRMFGGTGVLPRIQALPGLPALPPHGFDGEMHWLLDEWGDAEFVTLTPGLGRYFGADQGVLVARAPEEAALGLQDGDVIVAIGGREPQNSRHAMRILRSYQPGESVELRILRDRRTQTLNARIPERKAHDLLRYRHTPPAPPVPPAPPAPNEPAST